MEYHDDYQRFIEEWDKINEEMASASNSPLSSTLAKLALRDVTALVNHVRHWKARAQAAEAVSDVAGETLLGFPEF